MVRAMRKAGVLSILFVVALLGAVIAEAQQPTKVPRIGYLIGGTNSARNEAFRQGLRELGYAEGKNIIIVEARYTDARPERLADITAELVRLKVDIIVAGGGQSIRAAQKATKTIPIVMMAVSDAVMLGFVDSLARPGGNITGLTTQAPELGGNVSSYSRR
jgi:ABC-type uncharacterized transport system substrate-binding protein